MSAQKSLRGGVLTGFIGLFGFSALAGILITVMVTPAVSLTGIAATSTIGVFDDLPDYIVIGQQPERNRIWAHSAGGNVPIATIFNQNREEVRYDQISQYALDAAVAGEDERFFSHGGVDLQSVVRAVLTNAVSGGVKSGSSTLSMQLVKQIFVQQALEEPTEKERKEAYDAAVAEDYGRKLKEMKLAIGLEKRYTKKEILTAYLNIAFFGDGAYGIQAAAQRYFSINASDLTLAQAVSLIAIVQFPEKRGLDDPESFAANKARRDVILGSMLNLGMVTQEEYQAAFDTVVDGAFVIPSEPTSGCLGAHDYAKWFCDYVINNVRNFEFLGATEEEREKNWARGGYDLFTTLDLDIQTPTQDLVWQYVNREETELHLGGTGISVEVGTGRVLTMAQNKVFNDTQEGGGIGSSAVNFNVDQEYGASTGFPGGSTYKLFTLLEWLDSGKGLNQTVNGSARTVDQSRFRDTCADGGGPFGGTFQLKNDGGEAGAFTITQATARSINGAFITMAQQLDQCAIRGMAEALGVKRADGAPLQTNPSAVLGTNEITPLAMAGAYATVASGGKYCEPIVIDGATAPDGTPLPGQSPVCRQAITPEVAATAAYALEGVMTGGTGGRSNPDDEIPVLGKTGTTNNVEHTWIITSTTRVATAVWVGNWIERDSLSGYYWEGFRGNALRHEVMRGTLSAINTKYGGAEFPDPASGLLNGSTPTVVPDLRGQTPANAKNALESLGFSFVDGGPVDSEVEAGKVAGSDPVAGTPTATGAAITVHTSKGNKVPFPDVVADGKSYTSAQVAGALKQQGYTAVYEVCAELPAGTPANSELINKVNASDPAPGTLVVPGGQVTLSVQKLKCH